MLVVTAGLFVRTFGALVVRPLGFDRDRVLIVRVDSIRSHLSPEARSMLFTRLVDAASRVPGVERAAASAWTPLTDGGAMLGVTIAGAPADTERGVIANFITPGWFDTYGTPIVQGRDFDDRDVASGATGAAGQSGVRSALPSVTGSTGRGHQVVAAPHYRWRGT